MVRSIRAIERQAALRALDNLERDFAAGDAFALMKALRYCAVCDLVMPLWVSRAFLSGFRAVVNYRAASWDEVFGRPHPKGLHLSEARQRRELAPHVWVRVREILKYHPETPIDDGLFERVGAEFGISKTLCNKLYYQQTRYWNNTLPPKS